MIERMEVAGVHMDVEPKLHKYVVRKLGGMDRYIPRAAREPAHMEVKLKEKKRKTRHEYACEVILYLPQDTITITETTMNIYAAVDIVETRLKNQIKKYKDKHARGHGPKALAAKIRSRRGQQV